jgi:hypothetical protein
MKHNYQENRQRRIDNAEGRAAQSEDAADASYHRAQEISHQFPTGQPILVGHHSEGPHRRELERMEKAMRKSIAELDKAAYYAERVEAMESNRAISSDDPEAISKLEKKLILLEEIQSFMKAANNCIKKKDKEAFLQLDYGTEKLWTSLIEPDREARVGIPSYKLTNNNNNMRRIRERLAQLRKDATRTTTDSVIKGVRLILNAKANRVQLIFPAKPPKGVRQSLHKEYHFHWSETENAWQRFFNSDGVDAAKTFLENYTEV